MKLTFKHIFLSLFLGIALSITASLPVIANAENKQMQQEKVIGLYEELNEAVVKPDLVKLQRILSDDFKLVTIKKDVMTKQQWIKNIQKGGMKYCHINESKVKSRGYDDLTVTAQVMGEMWDNEGAWNIKFEIETEQRGDQLQITKIVAKELK